ncbi:hypothetical protein BJG93_21940 [Paraburkholderia sprentiae WSM5005]|uniref:Lipoprotein n=1 Tax=Paraburkholderia sprentiae WSM5005 TaxID=754502 RepID=A0A1I9YSR2_9BURK|nr:hypothetical protein [Paraburkholderia sprentiae]APA89230.1 hypothetical protein BJG93_21940 [Paraburkholderia sprentiae WSM5005]
MTKTMCIASAALLAFATIALNGCGADDSPSASNASTTAPAPNDAAQQPATAPTVTANASAPFADNAASGATGTADPITQNMQANLAADSQQVAPVMRYAPGDSANH